MIDDKTLTLFYFDDGLSKQERRKVSEALKRDPVLAAHFDALKQGLDTLADEPVLPAPEHLKHQWHDLVKREAARERQQSPAPTRRPAGFLWAGAMAAVLALGIAVGLFLAERSPAPMPDLVSTPDSESGSADLATEPDALARGLLVTLEAHQDTLDRLDGRPGDEQAALVLRIVLQNRIFERAAEQQASPEIARLLRALEPILLRLAEKETSPEDAAALRRQLAFEFEALLTKLQQSSSKSASA